MSGGSFNYLCYDASDADELIKRESDLSAMMERLVSLGALDAARETEDLILVIRTARIRIEARGARLSDVWKAVEWVDSCDWSKGHLDEALAKYRSE